MHLALGSLRACHSMTNEDCSPMTREDADNIMQVTAKSMLSSFYYLSSVIRLILWKEKSRHSRRTPIDEEFVKEKLIMWLITIKKENIIWKCDTLWLFMHKCLLECDQWLHKHPPPRKIWDPFFMKFHVVLTSSDQSKMKIISTQWKSLLCSVIFQENWWNSAKLCFLELKLVLKSIALLPVRLNGVF